MSKSQHENPLVCKDCGSLLVQRRVWIDPNTKAIASFPTQQGDEWCCNCECTTTLITQDEFRDKQDYHESDN